MRGRRLRDMNPEEIGPLSMPGSGPLEPPEGPPPDDEDERLAADEPPDVDHINDPMRRQP